MRFEPEYWRYEEITDHKNVVYVELREQLAAYQVANKLCEVADVFVVKDSPAGYFVEIQWVDEKKYPKCKTVKDIIKLVIERDLFGRTAYVDDLTGETLETDCLVQCLPYMEALKYRCSLPAQ